MRKNKQLAIIAFGILILFSEILFGAGSQEVARNLFKRMTGSVLTLDDPRLTAMSAKISNGDYLGAAQIAADDDGFYNVTLKQWAVKLSNLSESPIFRNPTALGSYGSGSFGSLNDFTATVIGAVRDNWDARLLLTSDYFYKGNTTVDRLNATPSPWSTLEAARSSIHSDVTLSSTNEHYIYLEKNNINLRRILVPAIQKIRIDRSEPAPTSAPPMMINNPDAAGLLSTRAFFQAHLTDGTNRRLIEYTFREFLCSPISEWADSGSVPVEISDQVVRRDIDRLPAGETTRFKDTCIRCHGGMDGLAGASAHFEFNIGVNQFRGRDFAFYKDTYDPLLNNTNGVMKKLNKNSYIYPSGKEVKDNSWVNYATKNQNLELGWTGTLSGNGIKQFGQMIGNSRGFTKCMAKRVFLTMCKREPSSVENSTIDALATAFAADKYNLRTLFMRSAILPTCLPQ